MYQFIYCLLIISIGFSGCQQSFPDKPFFNENNPDFFSYSLKQIDTKTPIKAALFANKKNNKLILEMQILNSLNQSINIDLNKLQIKTPDGLRSNPTISKIKSTKSLNKGEFHHFQISFNPINSLELYKNIGLNGDLKSNYSITLNFINSQSNNNILEGELNFTALNVDWENYKKNYATDDKIEIFYLQNDKKLFTENQKSYLEQFLQTEQKNNSSQSYSGGQSVSINDQEILINGIAIKAILYTINKKVYATINLINHSNYTISINPNLIFLEKTISKTSSKNVEFESINREILENNNSMELLKGKRYHNRFEFESTRIINDTIYFNLQGIVFKKHDKPVLKERLLFKKNLNTI